MNKKALLSLVLSIVTTALPQTTVYAAEPLPPRALARIGDHRFYHGPGITCAVLSSDGRRIASAASCNSDYVTDKEREAYDSAIVLWDAATGERLRELRVPHATTEITDLAFSPNGMLLAAAYVISQKKVGVGVFAVEAGTLLWQPKDFKEDVPHLHFSADSRQLHVSEEGGPVSVWNAVSGKQLRLCKPPQIPPKRDKNRVRDVRGLLSPDGKVIAWHMDLISENGTYQGSGELRVHNVATDKLLYQMNLKCDLPLRDFAFSRDGKRFAADCGHRLTVWETASGKELIALEMPDMEKFVLAPDGRRAAIYEYGSRLRLWDLQSGKPLRYLYPGFVFLEFCPRQAFSVDNKTLLLTTESTLRLFDTTTGKERVVSGHRAPIALRFSAEGRTLFTCCAERRCSWDLSGKQPALLTHEPRKAWEIDSLAHSADERLFLDSVEGRVRVRETATGRVLRALEGRGRPDYGRFSADAAQVVLTDDGADRLPEKIWLHDVKTGKRLGEIKPAAPVGHPVFFPNGRFITWADRAGNVHLHDSATAKTVRTLRSSRPLPVTDCDDAMLHFSPNNEYLIEGRPTLPMRVFHVSKGCEIARFYANPEKKSKAARLSCMDCSPDGRLLAVAEKESGIIRLIEIASGKVRAEFAGHRHGVRGLAFAPDGKTLASGGEDNVVFLWDVTGVKTPTAVTKTAAAWWSDLAGVDSERTGDAIAGLLRKPEASVAFLQERLHPVEVPDEKHLTRLLADLDSNAFAKREAASRELVQLGERAETTLRITLKNRPSLEMRRRIEAVLAKLERASLPPETLRILRTIEILEHLGTPAARRCLDTLAKGARQARPTREAKKALHRLAKRR